MSETQKWSHVAKPRRKRFKRRIARVEYIDVEVLAYTDAEANDLADVLAWSTWNRRGGQANDYTVQYTCLILSDDEIEHPEFEPFTLQDGDIPLDLTQDNWGHFRE